MLIRLPLLLILLILTACGPSSQTRPDNSEALAEQEQVATQLMQSGDFQLAAEEYLKLADSEKRYQALYQLKAAAAYYEAADLTSAKALLENIQTNKNQSQLAFQKKILQARIALSEQQADVALEMLKEAPEIKYADGLMYNFHGIRADAMSMKQEPMRAVQERARQFSYAKAIAYDDGLDRKMWQDVSALNQVQLQQLLLHEDLNLVAWAELAGLYHDNHADLTEMQERFYQWSLNYPQHAATPRVLAEIQENLLAQLSPPSHVALLLPLQGSLQQAATAIRDGFVANWYSDSNDKPELIVISANSLNILSGYQQAIDAGADFIVGPLEKQAIASLLEDAHPDKRLLLLNHYEGNLDALTAEQVKPGKGLFQLALSPENEAQQTAERAIAGNLNRSVVIYEDNSWGRRSVQAFKERYESIGGTLLKQVSFNKAEDTDLSKPVKYMLGIEESRQRARDLQAHLGRKIHSEERRRQDISFIYMLAHANDARQLMPHIYFQRAQDIPVYSSSLIHSAIPDPERDKDLNNIIFPDIPWLLNPNTEVMRITATLDQTQKLGSANSQRLHALGYDAYEIIKNLTELNQQQGASIPGATGDLYLSERGEIHRHMDWAHYVDGRPQRLYD